MCQSWQEKGEVADVVLSRHPEDRIGPFNNYNSCKH